MLVHNTVQCGGLLAQRLTQRVLICAVALVQTFIKFIYGTPDRFVYFYLFRPINTLFRDSRFFKCLVNLSALD